MHNGWQNSSRTDLLGGGLVVLQGICGATVLLLQRRHLLPQLGACDQKSLECVAKRCKCTFGMIPLMLSQLARSINNGVASLECPRASLETMLNANATDQCTHSRCARPPGAAAASASRRLPQLSASLHHL